MYCLRNVLPVIAQRAMVEDAIEAGIGQRHRAIRHYSVAPVSRTSTWHVVIDTFTAGQIALDLEESEQSPRRILTRVRDALAGMA